MATLVTGRLESGMGYGPCHVLKPRPRKVDDARPAYLAPGRPGGLVRFDFSVRFSAKPKSPETHGRITLSSFICHEPIGSHVHSSR